MFSGKLSKNNMDNIDGDGDKVKKRWSVISMLAGAGVGAAAVSLMKNTNTNKKSNIEKMATDFLKEQEDPVFR